MKYAISMAGSSGHGGSRRPVSTRTASFFVGLAFVALAVGMTGAVGWAASHAARTALDLELTSMAWDDHRLEVVE